MIMRASRLRKYIFILFFAFASSLAAAKTAQNSQTATTKARAPARGAPTQPASTSEKTTVLAERVKQEKEVTQSVYGVNLYRPNYILPVYYTSRPYASVYAGTTPDNQRIDEFEFQGQISLKTPIFIGILKKNLDLYVAYTQLIYWQFYADSKWFRETNYEPEIFLTYTHNQQFQADFGLVHQSNGRGGDLERSWNRAYTNLKFSGSHWLVSVKPWLLIFKRKSSNVHNPDIAHYLGYEQVLLAYTHGNQQYSLTLRNTAESGFNRAAYELTWSYPVLKHFRLYLKAFSGYGQSLIEYNHYTNSAGVGIALNDWI